MTILKEPESLVHLTEAGHLPKGDEDWFKFKCCSCERIFMVTAKDYLDFRTTTTSLTCPFCEDLVFEQDRL